jgi:hypothetical protein
MYTRGALSNREILERRTEKLLRQIVAEYPEAETPPFFLAVICNRCGVQASASTLEALELQTIAWRLSEEYGGDDYCAVCVR